MDTKQKNKTDNLWGLILAPIINNRIFTVLISIACFAILFISVETINILLFRHGGIYCDNYR